MEQENKTENIEQQKAVGLDALVIQQAALRKEIDDLQTEINIKRNTLRTIENGIASIKCPFKIGDKITNGKEQYFLSKITYESYGQGYKLYGHKILKDGSSGKLERDIWTWNREIKLVV